MKVESINSDARIPLKYVRYVYTKLLAHYDGGDTVQAWLILKHIFPLKWEHMFSPYERKLIEELDGADIK
jgi:hypothetical protein